MKTRVKIQWQPVYPAYIAKAPRTLRLPDSPPRVLPYHKDTAHTIPTRWGLYRALLKHTGRASISGPRDDVDLAQPDGGSGSRTEGEQEGGRQALDNGQNHPLSSVSRSRWPNIYEMVRSEWRDQRLNLSVVQTRQFLTHYYSILSHLESTSTASQISLREMEDMAEKTLAVHREEEARRQAEQEELRASRRNARGRLTGGFLYPNHFLPPLPRLVPQPPKISGMYRARLRRRDLRLMRLRDIEDSINDVKEEIQFLSRLGPVDADWDLYGPGGWVTSHSAYRADCQARNAAEEARAKMLFTEEVVLKVRRARRERHKTYMSFAWQRKEKKLANAAKRRQERQAFGINRERNRLLREERLRKTAEGTIAPAGPKGMYWDGDRGGGFRRNKSFLDSTIPRMSLQGFMEKKAGI